MYIAIGIDPGVRHQGVVIFQFDYEKLELVVQPAIFTGDETVSLIDFINDYSQSHINDGDDVEVIVEKFVIRRAFKQTKSITESIALMKHLITVKVHEVYNSGIDFVINKHWLRLLDVHAFDVPTHHNDLRSAAKIALFHIIKKHSDTMMSLLFDEWTIVKQPTIKSEGYENA